MSSGFNVLQDRHYFPAGFTKSWLSLQTPPLFTGFAEHAAGLFIGEGREAVKEEAITKLYNISNFRM